MQLPLPLQERALPLLPSKQKQHTNQKVTDSPKLVPVRSQLL